MTDTNRPRAEVPVDADKDLTPIFALWTEYERVAMHFNDLIIRLRTQSLGGVAAVATIATVLSRGDISHELRWGTLTVTFFLLSLFWVAVWVLDFGYYNRLLLGAVDAIIELEKQSGATRYASRIDLSTRIEAAVLRGISGRVEASKRTWARWWFYLIVLAGLLISLWVSIRQVGGLCKTISHLIVG